MTIIEKISQAISLQSAEMTEDQINDIDSSVQSADELKGVLPDLKSGIDAYKEQETNCDNMISNWNAQKKLWKNRGEAVAAFISRAMTRFGLKTLDADGAAVKSTTRSVIVVNDEGLLAPYKPAVEALSRQLPEYVKLEMKIDKTKLNAHVNANPAILVNQPQDIYREEKTTYSLK